ncbi:MAG TPA: hypothetical protein VFK47_06865 [Ktedonobacteraceae bacterium]|nr:hypothetical protein [Ktedonobacteraceae bacterium]
MPSSHKLVKSEHARQKVHGTYLLGQFNSWLALRITNAVGSMWCAYVFAAIALFSFPQALIAFWNGDTLLAVGWLSQSFIQLVLLPVIMVGQRVLSEAQDARAETDHSVLTALHDINVVQLDILRRLDKLDDQSTALS